MIFKLVLQLLNIKIKQIGRTLVELGIIRLCILFFFYCYYQFFLIHIRELHAFFVSAALLSIISAVHSNRKDEKILLQLMQFPVLYYLIENAIWTLLFTWGIMFSDSNMLYPIVFVIPLIGSFLPTNRLIENQGFVLPLPFSKIAYDWKAGMRNGGSWSLLVTFILAIVGVFRFEFALVSIVVASISIANFYTHNEPRQLLYAIADDSKEFLKKKILNMVVLFTLINTFTLVVGLFLYFDIFYIIAYLYLASMFILFLTILQKYITYEPDTVFKANTVLNVFYYSSIFIPFLLPLPIFVAIRSWKKANNQLSFYF